MSPRCRPHLVLGMGIGGAPTLSGTSPSPFPMRTGGGHTGLVPPLSPRPFRIRARGAAVSPPPPASPRWEPWGEPPVSPPKKLCRMSPPPAPSAPGALPALLRDAGSVVWPGELEKWLRSLPCAPGVSPRGCELPPRPARPRAWGAGRGRGGAWGCVLPLLGIKRGGGPCGAGPRRRRLVCCADKGGLFQRSVHSPRVPRGARGRPRCVRAGGAGGPPAPCRKKDGEGGPAASLHLGSHPAVGLAGGPGPSAGSYGCGATIRAQSERRGSANSRLPHPTPRWLRRPWGPQPYPRGAGERRGPPGSGAGCHPGGCCGQSSFLRRAGRGAHGQGGRLSAACHPAGGFGVRAESSRSFWGKALRRGFCPQTLGWELGQHPYGAGREAPMGAGHKEPLCCPRPRGNLLGRDIFLPPPLLPSSPRALSLLRNSCDWGGHRRSLASAAGCPG